MACMNIFTINQETVVMQSPEEVAAQTPLPRDCTIAASQVWDERSQCTVWYFSKLSTADDYMTPGRLSNRWAAEEAVRYFNA